ncbi:MAG: SDR family NAD(P)-dependent oxidoreductase [Bacteroidota bacterium]
MSKTILITGSTDGIGKLAALNLAKKGHQVYLHGRNKHKLQQVIEEIKAEARSENVSGLLADFSDLDAVKEMSDQIKTSLSSLDVLINNAGIFNSPIKKDKNGIDIRFTVNFWAPVLLTNQLIPLLRKSKEPRIINLGSAAQAPVTIENLTGPSNLPDQNAYAQSKLALTMWTFYLAETIKEISSIVVNPGSLLDTKMAKEAFGQVWSSADKGSDILHDLAVAEKYHGISGEYFDNDQGGFGQAHPEAYNKEKTKALVETIKQYLKP